MRTALRIVALVGALVAAWLLVLRPSPSQGPLTVPGTNVPDARPTLAPEDTSLDLRVVGEVGHPVVYAVELRRAPDHRLLALDPATGEVRTIRSLTDAEQAFGLSLHPDGARLAVGWSPDVNLRGNGLALVDVAGGDLVEVVPTATGVYLTDPLWVDDRTVLLTRTDVRAGAPTFDVVSVDVEAGTVTPVLGDAVTAVVVDGVHHFLQPDEQANGRSVRRVEADGTDVAIVSGEGETTIDHLLALPDGSLLFAVHQVDEGGLTVGAPADAHQGPSVWWTVDPRQPDPVPLGPGPLSVTDAVVSRFGALVATDREGLTIHLEGRRTRVVASRSLVFVAA